MTDLIKISDLVVEARIGVTAAERAVTRPLRIDISMVTDTRDSAESDDLSDTVGYDVVAMAVADLVRARERNLLELLAEEIAALILTFKRISSVTVEVEKGNPPIEEDIRAVSVVITRP